MTTPPGDTAMNLILFLSAFLAQLLIGAVIDLFPETVDGGYDRAGYRWGFGGLLVLQLLAMIWYFHPRHRTHPVP